MSIGLAGTLVLEAAVGCPSSCGAHGRCWATPAASNGTDQAVACECECGWSGGVGQRCSAGALLAGCAASVQQTFTV